MPQLFGFPGSPSLRGPTVLPGIGFPLALFRFLDDPVGRVLALQRLGRDVVPLVGRNPAIVCVFGYERARDVLSEPARFRHDEHLFDGPPGSAFGTLSHCLVALNGQRHRRQRELLQPAFARAPMEGYAADIVQHTARTLASWPVDGAEPLDVAARCRDLTLGIAMKCFYGLEPDEAKAGIGRIVDDFMHVVTAPSTILFPVDLPGSPQRRKLRLAEALAKELRSLLARKRTIGGAPRDAVGLLMAARDADGGGLSDDELMGEALELVVAGHDTSAMALAWTLFLLDRHPAVLRELKAELDTTLEGRAPTLPDLLRLPVLDRVVKESLRVLSPAPMQFLRTCAEPDTALGEHRLPQHANVLVSPIAIHRDARVYPEPMRFRPSRWIDWSPPAYAYLPFGAGPRACVGMLFAAQSIRLMLAMILQKVQLRCVEGAQVARLTRGNIMHARHGLAMRAGSADTPPLPVRGDVHELVDWG
nr:cytochrome P450 [Panacagrimonas sp.]